jgi:hypothetical protein
MVRAARLLARHQAEEGTEPCGVEPSPVAELDGQSECGQCRDATQAAEPADDWCVWRCRGDLGDHLIDPVATCLRPQHTAVALVEADRERPREGAARRANDRARASTPSAARSVHAATTASRADAAPHQIRARVLTCPDKIARGLVELVRHRHRRRFAQSQKLSQPLRVAPVGLDPLRRRARDLPRLRHQTDDPARAHARARPKPVGPAS